MFGGRHAIITKHLVTIIFFTTIPGTQECSCWM